MFLSEIRVTEFYIGAHNDLIKSCSSTCKKHHGIQSFPFGLDQGWAIIFNLEPKCDYFEVTVVWVPLE
jgi:hypothetical protein